MHLRHDNLHLHDLIATHTLPRSRSHTFLPQPQLLSRLRAWRNLQLRSRAAFMGIDRRHINLRSQRGFRHRNRNSYIYVIRAPRKYRMRPRLDNQKQITRRPTIGPCVAFARQTNPLTIPGPRLNPKLQRLPLRHHALAIAGRARVLHLPRTTAPRTLDIKLHPSAHLRHLSRPMALRTLHAPARRRLALARRANLLPLNLQPCHTTPHRRPEIHTHLVLKIGPRLRPTRCLLPAVKHPAEDMLEATAKPATRFLLGRASTLKVREIEP